MRVLKLEILMLLAKFAKTNTAINSVLKVNYIYYRPRDLWHLETQRPWAVVTERSEVTTKGLRCLTYLDYSSNGLTLVSHLTVTRHN